MSRPSMAADGLVKQLGEMQRQIETLSAMVVRPEASQSLYDRLPKVLIGRDIHTANATFSNGQNTDFVIAGVAGRADRSYWAYVRSQILINTLSNWNVLLTADNGTTVEGVDRFWREPDGGNANPRTIAAGVLWEPPADGTYTLRVRQANGAGTIQYQANTAVDDSAARRYLLLWDIGPRPS